MGFGGKIGTLKPLIAPYLTLINLENNPENIGPAYMLARYYIEKTIFSAMKEIFHGVIPVPKSCGRNTECQYEKEQILFIIIFSIAFPVFYVMTRTVGRKYWITQSWIKTTRILSSRTENLTDIFLTTGLTIIGSAILDIFLVGAWVTKTYDYNIVNILIQISGSFILFYGVVNTFNLRMYGDTPMAFYRSSLVYKRAKRRKKPVPGADYIYEELKNAIRKGVENTIRSIKQRELPIDNEYEIDFTDMEEATGFVGVDLFALAKKNPEDALELTIYYRKSKKKNNLAASSWI